MSQAIRLATAADLQAINDIYNHYVHASTATYQLENEPMESRRAWFASHGTAHPITVIEQSGHVVGWGSLSPFHRRSAYSRTVENSIYVRHDSLRRGFGAALLDDLIARARALQHHTLMALIDAQQPASVALHKRFGFEQVAYLREVGFKFDRWLDVVYLQLML